LPENFIVIHTKNFRATWPNFLESKFETSENFEIATIQGIASIQQNKIITAN